MRLKQYFNPDLRKAVQEYHIVQRDKHLHAEKYGLTPEGVDYALSQYQIVICEITHGMLSKLSYDAKDIIRTAQERWCDLCDLKEQEREEARLLTLDEVLEHYSLPPVFVDDLSMQEDYCMDIKPLYFDFPTSDEISFIEHWRGYYQVRQHLGEWKKSYGKKWVCWTDKPTDKQRRVVKWDAQ